ncbi:MAG: PfkB family carbohydrate kinase, partial [Thermodesulfobacteriota bacterium]
MQKNSRITGIGSALVDILINESDEFLSSLGKEKGGMTLVEDTDIQKILSASRQKPFVVPGGAACNTIVGVACLGGDARFIGKRGDDSYGETFEQKLVKSRVEPLVSTSSSPTGKVLSVITPDAQRSMFTFLGASTELDPESITSDMFKRTAITMIEGYLLFNK